MVAKRRLIRNNREFFSLIDLGIAYRKAKADLYYSSRACRQALADFESDLPDNLRALKQKLLTWDAPDFGNEPWTLVPKGFKDKEPVLDIISSDPQFLWDAMHKAAEENNESGKVKAEFRLMEKLPIDFHVFAALWINKVGHKFEEKLTEAARGNRLRRGKNNKINPFSIGSALPYLHAYKQWRDHAFNVMENALESQKTIVAITADVSSFYHELDVRFMLSEDFLNRIDVKLIGDEKKFHSLFINALHQWAQSTRWNEACLWALPPLRSLPMWRCLNWISFSSEK